MITSPFGEIMRQAVEATPGAVGGAFAARDGETVDSFAVIDSEDWAIFTAHYGVLLAHVQSALRTFHYGEARFLILSHTRMEVLVHAVAEGYYALIAINRPAPLGIAARALERAAAALRKEMG
jgi:hypothetical protein